MKFLKNIFVLPVFLLLFSPRIFAQNETAKPVSPNASPEARALLQLLYNLSGKYTLTGQHNFPLAHDRNSVFAANYTGKMPAIWSIDFGFAKAGDKDSYKEREHNVAEAIRQYKKGSIVSFCWHAVPPTANEPVTFQPVPGSDTPALASVQGRLTDEQFKDIITPGTSLYKHWAQQVDTIAYYLKQLQKAHVPVLWRPYHEMNGNWFWWGNRTGQYSTAALYRQIFDRMVNYHKLNNLLWVWSVDRPTKPGMEFSNFYPGDKYLDILALDVYGSDFKQVYYDQLLALAKGKPITLGEVGSPPSPQVMDKQPKWSYWIIWAGMVRNTSKKDYEALMNDPRVIGRDDPAYINALNPFRKELGQPLLSLNKPADFSGEWVLNEDKSTFDNFGSGNLPHKLKIIQKADEISVQKSFIEEWRDDVVTVDTLKLNGTEGKTEYMNFPGTTTAKLSPDADTLTIDSKIKFGNSPQAPHMQMDEVWTELNHGGELSVTQTSKSPRDERKITMIYDRQE